MYINKINYPEFPQACVISNKYSGVQDYDTEYLGYDRQLPFLPKIKLGVTFIDNNEVDDLMEWWKDACNRGTKVFIIKSRFFGKEGSYGVRFISAITHTNPRLNEVSFTVEVLFDVDSVKNLPPVAMDKTISVNENSKDNFVILDGVDPEFDGLMYEIILPPSKGTVRQSGRILLYTPDIGYKGSDCLNFIVKDRFNISRYATVTIAVGNVKHVESEFIYTFESGTQKVNLVGNYHWQYTDPTTTQQIHYGTGETITTPPNINGPWELRIWSNDHQLNGDPSLAAVQSIEVANWGERTNYANFFADMSHLGSITTLNAIGTCKGINFDHAFRGLRINPPEVDMTNAIYVRGMFKDTSFNTMPTYKFTNVQYAQGMFEGSSSKFVTPIVLPKVDYAQDMFRDSNIFCLQALNVTNAISTAGIMTNATFINQPNQGQVNDFETGAIKTFTGAVCVANVGEVVLTKRTNAVVLDPLGSASAGMEFDINPTGLIGTPTYKWTHTVGTPTGGDTSKKLVLDIPNTLVGEHAITVSCEVTDTKGTYKSGDFIFRYKGIANYLSLNIPKQYEPLNLKTFITAHNPTNKSKVLLINNRVNGQFVTGDLTGLDVTLHNTGEIQAYSRPDGKITTKESAALIATSSMTLVNDGWIRGCGGKGGNGGDGANGNYTKYKYETKYNFALCPSDTKGNYWFAKLTEGNGVKRKVLSWDGKDRWISNHNLSAWETIVGISGHFRVAAYKMSRFCSYPTAFYGIERRTTEKGSSIGGTGGLGGQGQGYGVKAGLGGKGKPSKPTGGNSGKDGGAGGAWAVNGLPSADGVAGLSAGKSIIGLSKLTVITKGNLSGATS